MSKPMRGTQIAISPRRPKWPWIVLAMVVLVGAYCAFARSRPGGRSTTYVSTGHWLPLEPPAWVIGEKATAGNNGLTSLDASGLAATKRVRTLRVTPGGTIEKNDVR